MSMSYSRASRLASLNHKEFDFQFFVYQQEVEYKTWLGAKRVSRWIHRIADDTSWNCFMCMISLFAIVFVAVQVGVETALHEIVFHIFYNVIYFVNSALLFYIQFAKLQKSTWATKFGFVLDVLSNVHYLMYYLFTIGIVPLWVCRNAKIACYYLRLYRPVRYLWFLNDTHLIGGGVIGTTLKYVYIFCLLRVTYAILWIHLIWYEINFEQHLEFQGKLSQTPMFKRSHEEFMKNPFLWCLYLVDKMFIPIGPQVYPFNDLERVLTMVVMVTGNLTGIGFTIANLAIVTSVVFQHEESFRARLAVITNDMVEMRVPKQLREKVKTFYRMFWHKQKAISGSVLMPTFPPTTFNHIYSEIYFEAQQKSRILRDLPNQFLEELAKSMTTINYIPGDWIIKRKSTKASIIYIAYGDIEMMTGEDDVTPMLRFSRGTVINGCGGCPAVGCARSHVEIRAATFCTAHVLSASNLWKVAVKFGKSSEIFIIHSSFEEHFERVRRHYEARYHPTVKYKSSILYMKNNLMDLKHARDADGKLLLERIDVFLEIAGCYVMRNRNDSSLMDESDRICLRSTFPCILQPVSSLLVAWNAFVALLTFVVAVTHPYNLVHKREISRQFRFFDYLVSGIFILDIITHLSTGDKIEDGLPISFKQTSIHQMRTIWFGLDVLAVLPIFEFVGNSFFTGINKLCKLPKLFRTLKQMETEAECHTNVFRFLSYMLVGLLSSYLIACLQQGFMCFTFEYCEVTSLSVSPFWSKTPLNTENEEIAIRRLYLSLYWAITMSSFSMHKTFTWGAEFWQTRLFIMLIMEASMIIFIFIVSVCIATVMAQFAMRQAYDACISTVKTFLTDNNVDPVVRHRFINYLQLCWHTDRAYSITHSKQSLLFDLPAHVSNELLYLQRSKYILGLPFSKFLSEQDLTLISSSAQLFYTCPNEILQNTGDVCHEMYIIKQGFCEVLNPDTMKVVNTICSKEYFGVLECLLRIPSYYTVRAVTHVQVLSIHNTQLKMILTLPKLKDAINFAKLQSEHKNLLISRRSFIEYMYPAPTPNRSKFPLPRKHEPDTLFLHPFQQLGVLSFLRYVFPRWTIRPDGRYMQCYEWLRVLCAILCIFVFPNYIYFQFQFTWLRYLAILLDYSAYFDIFQRMLVGYYNEKGILVYHPASTAMHYFKGAFTADLFASLPLEILALSAARMHQSITRPAFYLVPPLAQYLMFNRLLQLYRLPNMLKTLSVYIEREDILLIIKGMPLLLGLLNVMTSFLFLESIDMYAPYGGNEWYFEEKPMNETWITTAKSIFNYDVLESPFTFHLTCYFWAVYEVTGTGFNVFHPHDIFLLKILCFGNIIGRVLKTYIFVYIISIRACVNEALATFQEHMRDFKMYMIREKIKPRLQNEVFNYYTYNWNKLGGTNYSNVLTLCDQVTLRIDTIMHIYGSTFNKCPVLLDCDLPLLGLIGRAVNSIYFLANTRFIEKNDVIEDMYFVNKGTVVVRDSNDDNLQIMKLPRGSIFGNLEQKKRVRCMNTFMADSNVHLLKINALVFYKIISEFPKNKTLMEQYRVNNENYIIGGQMDTRAMPIWKERTPSSTNLYETHEGTFKYCDMQRSNIMHIYLIIVSLLSIYTETYNITFQDNRLPLVVILYLLDFLFFLKMVINYAMANGVFDTKVKLNLLNATKRYCKGVFKYDVISCVPFELFCFLAQNKWMAFSCLRLNRLFRAVTISECMRKHRTKPNINLVLSMLVSMIIWFMLYIHCMTCAWCFIGKLEDERAPNSSWLHLNTTTAPCQWPYLCAFYFTLTTFTIDGVGDILPKVQSEVIFTCFLQIVSVLLYMIYVGGFSYIIRYKSFRFFEFCAKYAELLAYMKSTRVSKNLMKMINKYSLHLWRESRGVQMPYFLETAPQHLQTKVMSAAYMTHLTQHPTFRTCEPAFNRQLVRHLRMYFYDDAMYVVKQNEITDSMYMIHRGTVEEVAEDLEEQTQLLNDGDNFGIPQGLERNTPFTFSYRVIGKAQILTLSLDDWKYLVKHFQKSKNVIFKDKDIDQDRKLDHVVKKATVKSTPDKSKTDDLQAKSSPDTDIARSLDDRQELTNVVPTVSSPPAVPEIIKAVVEAPLTFKDTIKEPDSAEKPSDINSGLNVETTKFLEDHQETEVFPVGTIAIPSSESINTVTATMPTTLGTTAITMTKPITPERSVSGTKPLISAETSKDLQSNSKLRVGRETASTFEEQAQIEETLTDITPFKSKVDAEDDTHKYTEEEPPLNQLKSETDIEDGENIPLKKENLGQLPAKSTEKISSTSSIIRPSKESLKSEKAMTLELPVGYLTNPKSSKTNLESFFIGENQDVSPVEKVARDLLPAENLQKSDDIEVHTHFEAGEDEDSKFTVRRKSTLTINRDEIDVELKMLESDNKEETENDIPKFFDPVTDKGSSQPGYSHNRRKTEFFTLDPHDFARVTGNEKNKEYQDSPLKTENLDQLHAKTAEISSVGIRPFKESVTSNVTPEKDESVELPIGNLSDPKIKTESIRNNNLFSLKPKPKPLSSPEKEAMDPVDDIIHDLLNKVNRKKSSDTETHLNTRFKSDLYEDTKFSARHKSTTFDVNGEEIEEELKMSENKKETESDITKSFGPVTDEGSSQPGFSHDRGKSEFFTLDPHDLERVTGNEKNKEYQDSPLKTENLDQLHAKTAEISSVGIRPFKESVTSNVTPEKDESVELPIGNLSDPKIKTESIRNNNLFSLKPKPKPLSSPEKEAMDTVDDITHDLLNKVNREKSSNTETRLNTHFKSDLYEDTKFTARHKSTTSDVNGEEIEEELKMSENEKDTGSDITKSFDPVTDETSSQPGYSHNRRKSEFFDLTSKTEDEKGIIIYQDSSRENENVDQSHTITISEKFIKSQPSQSSIPKSFSAAKESSPETNTSHNRQKSTFYTTDSHYLDTGVKEDVDVYSDKPHKEGTLNVLLSPTTQISLESYKYEHSITELTTHPTQATTTKNPSAMPGPDYKTFDAGYKHSLSLSFRDKIDTFEVSNDDAEVRSDEGVTHVNEKDSVASMIAYADGVAMKKERAELSKSKKSEDSDKKKD